MNQYTISMLEYPKIINKVKEYCISEMAKKEVDKIQPIADVNVIRNQLIDVDEARILINQRLSIPIVHLGGIENVLNKLDKDMVLSIEELVAVQRALLGVKKMISFMNDKKEEVPKITSYARSMFALTDVGEEIEKTIYNGRIEDKATSKLNDIRKQIYIVEGRIKSKLDDILKSSKNKQYLQEVFPVLRFGKQTIALKSQYKHMIQGAIVDTSGSGSTLFVVPDALKKLQTEKDILLIEEEKEIYQILYYLTMLIDSYKKELGINISCMVHYDVIFAKAKYSKEIDGVSPTLNVEGTIDIIEGRHPLLQGEVVPLNLTMDKSCRGLIITGPNTGGKTVVLKTLGLITLMAQSGLHIPVKEESKIAVFSDVLCDIGDQQSIEQSLSTFSSHIKNIIKILSVANPYTLVLVDEIGSGTDPVEAEGLAVSILETLYEYGATIVATSHYGKVKVFGEEHNGFRNGKMDFDVETLKPLYKLIVGASGESNAFLISLKLGMSPSLIERAHYITYQEEKKYLNEDATVDKRSKGKKPIERKYLETAVNKVVFKIGDLVKIDYMKEQGIVYALENKEGYVGVQIRGTKQAILAKRLTPYIDALEMYPEDYDFDIIFKDVAERKQDHLMSRKYVPNKKKNKS